MIKVKDIKKYAMLIAKYGINASNKQNILLQASVDMAYFVKYLVSALYDLNAKKVKVVYYDDEVLRITLSKSNDRRIEDFFNAYEVALSEEMIHERFSNICLVGDNVTLFNKINLLRYKSYLDIYNYHFRKYEEVYAHQKIARCFAPVPTKKWASHLYPDLTPTAAVDKLWKDIFEITLKEDIFSLDEDTVNQLFKKKIDKLTMRANTVNKLQLAKLHITDSNGTDLHIELSHRANWQGPQIGENSLGHLFIPAIPTRRIYTTPFNTKTEGILKIKSPIVYLGRTISDIELRFKQGKVHKFNCNGDPLVLEDLLLTDRGASFLGEIGIVSYNNEIELNPKTFYNNILDRSRRPYLSLGNGLIGCIEGGHTKTDEELQDLGLNSSKIHYDLILDAKEITITGSTYNNRKVDLFKDGKWLLDVY